MTPSTKLAPSVAAAAVLLSLASVSGCHQGDSASSTTPGSGNDAASSGGSGGGSGGGGSNNTSPDGAPSSSGGTFGSSRYIPLAVGASWTWNGYDMLSGASGTTDSRIEAMEMMTGAKAGISAYRVRSKTLNGSTVNWQQDTGTSIIRHREQFLDATGAVTSDHLFTPSKLRLDESPAHTALHATWTETYTDMALLVATVTVTWTVEAVDEMVTVPAGTFKCLRVHAVEKGGAAYDSTFWFARGVGKVKESGTEERQLVKYNIP